MKRVIICAVLAAASELLVSAALAEGLVKASPRQILVEGATRAGTAARQTSTPVPLRQGVFVLSFATGEVDGGVRSSIAAFQQVDSTFAKLGPPGRLTTGPEDCCASFAENGGAKLGGGKTLLALPLFTFDGAGLDVYGFPVASDGNSVQGGVALSRKKPGPQTGPVIVPLKNGRAFAMYRDDFNEPDESDTSARGVLVSVAGNPVGEDILLESMNEGAQSAADGVQLADDRILAVLRVQGESDVTGRVLFYGRFLGPNGSLQGSPFLMAATNDGTTGIRVAALPNGNFVVVWIDDRLLFEAIPLFRIFSPTGEPLTHPQRVGDPLTRAVQLDVAALSDSRFVIVGTFFEAEPLWLAAQLVSPAGTKIGVPLILQAASNPPRVEEVHVANAGYLLGRQPTAGQLATATDPRQVFVTWRLRRTAATYDLIGQALRTAP